jgi:putative ABC transport system permease protein
MGHDLRFAFRQLRKMPGFTLTVVLTLALGIGATTAIFSLVEGVLLRPLPFHDPDRLVILGDHLAVGLDTPVLPREIGIYSAATSAFSSMGGYITTKFELSGAALPEDVNAARITASVFPTLGVQPTVGRVFTQQEDDAKQPVAVISYSLWVNRFGRDPHVLGRSVVLDRKAYTIIGVMPRSFEFPLDTGHLDQIQIWVPTSFTREELDPESGSWAFHIVARLRDGVTVRQAAQDADRVAQQIVHELPPSMAALRIRGDAIPLRDYTVAEARPLLRILFLAVSVVLLIACVNVAGLLLVRAIRRRREYAVRLALGARSLVIIRESVFEGVLLSLLGGALGLILAAIAIRTTLHLLPNSMPRIDAISINLVVAAFAVGVSLLTGILCSLAPAFAALRTNLIEALKEGTQSGTAGSHHTWLRSAFVVSEIAVALVLLTVSGAFVRSLQKMRAVDPGFRPDHVLVAGYSLPQSQYPTDTSVETFDRTLADRLSSKPGMVAVGLTSALPSSGTSALGTYTIEGEPATNWKMTFGGFTLIYGDYFRAMSIPLLEGRTFTNEDRAGKPLVVVINRWMATHAWPGQSPIGKRMHIGNPKKGLPWATVVGVVADTKIGPRDEPTDAQWYIPALQPAMLVRTPASSDRNIPVSGYIALRSSLPPENMIDTLRSTVAEIDPLLALDQIQPMDSVISDVEAPRRFNTALITAFAFGALLLSIVGIYAVVAFSVSVRRQEIAIRMALGAQRGAIARLVLVSAAKMAMIGCALGVIGSLAFSHLVSALLFQVSATDPVIYAASVAVMVLMALIASALPATRAASGDPIVALRGT